MPQRTSHDRRLERIATTDEYAQAVQRRFGFAPQGVGALLDLAEKLLQPTGGTLNRDDIATLCELHPTSDPKAIAATAAAINAAEPRLRGQYFVAALTSDSAVADDRLHEASANYREVEKLARGWADEGYIEELSRRRDQPVGKMKQPEITRQPADPLSVRSVIEKQFEHPGARAVVEAVDQGDPDVVYATRNALADRMEAASAHLASGDGDLRSTLSAAFDVSEIERHAVDEGWLPQAEG